MSWVCGLRCTISRACSATATVCLSVAPGGSSMLTCVCDRSSGGMKPVDSRPISPSEPKKNTMVISVVSTRWRRHQPTVAM